MKQISNKKTLSLRSEHLRPLDDRALSTVGAAAFDAYILVGSGKCESNPCVTSQCLSFAWTCGCS